MIVCRLTTVKLDYIKLTIMDFKTEKYCFYTMYERSHIYKYNFKTVVGAYKNRSIEISDKHTLSLHTEKWIYFFFSSMECEIASTIFPLICKQSNFWLVPEQTENCWFGHVPFNFAKKRKCISMCVCFIIWHFNFKLLSFNRIPSGKIIVSSFNFFFY